MSDTRDIRFMRTALAVAEIWSKDPSSKVGCLAVGDMPNLVAWGYNGFPPGIADTPDRLENRSLKLQLTIHAEQNALMNATFPARTLYVTRPPCDRCALTIIAARTVRRVVYLGDAAFEQRWADSLDLAALYLREAGIDLDRLALASKDAAPKAKGRPESLPNGARFSCSMPGPEANVRNVGDGYAGASIAHAETGDNAGSADE